MLEITIVELILRAIPEAFLLILGGCIISRKSIDNKSYLIASMLFGVSTYLVRMLPIQFGVHTIIIIMIFILINTSLNKIPIRKAISSSLISIITLSICESINLFILNFLKIDVQAIIDNPLLKTLYFMPSLALFALIILIFYVVIRRNKKEGSKNVLN